MNDALARIKQPIEADLERYRALFKTALKHDNPLLDVALTHLSKRPGKMMRPILTLLAARYVGDVNENVLHAAVSLELLHTASLVHDDVVDKSDRRRGQQSVNALMDNQAAVLVGDFLLSRALEHAALTGNIEVVKAISLLGQTLADGELMQMAALDFKQIDEETYYQVIERKTASLFATSAKVGAMLAGGNKEQVETMHDFGLELGLCFQIRDDIFDYNPTADLGKPTGIDMQEGKLTLPVIYAVTKPEAKAEYQKALEVRQGKASDEDISNLIQFAKEKGGVDYAYRQMEERSKKAISLLHESADKAITDALSTYVSFVAKRDL